MHTTKYPTKKVYPPAKRAGGRGLTSEEYDAIRQKIADEIPFNVRVTVNEQAYAFGTLNIGPTKEDRRAGQPYQWAEEQYQTIQAFMVRHGLTITTPDLLQPDKFYCFGQGINYIYKVEE